ncbi:MAG: NAD(P)H-binding protein [Cyclobacteriaceae bacterium]|nr:NAD(P)H-binding protein [Cyclobacteriaceae bacterium]
MKIVVTGSLGHISKPLSEKLIKAGHQVTIVTSQAGKIGAIESIGAQAAVGSLEDADFMLRTLQGADAAYLMIPPTHNPGNSWIAYQRRLADLLTEAVAKSKVARVVLLSSVGAHLGKGAGPVDGISYFEWKLNQLKTLHLRILRPSYFFYNLFSQIGMVKGMNIFGGNFGGSDEKLVLTHTEDIADAAAEELLKPFKGQAIRYVASDERHPREVAAVLGKAVGKPGLPWVEFKDEDSLGGMLQAGVPEVIAKAYVEMGGSLRKGKMQEDYWKNRPRLGKRKLEDFAKEFAAAYNH